MRPIVANRRWLCGLQGSFERDSDTQLIIEAIYMGEVLSRLAYTHHAYTIKQSHVEHVSQGPTRDKQNKSTCCGTHTTGLIENRLLFIEH
mmetsp:Transcript_20355/g.49513  ORF Transcript_20355/g.49513 Transcript_20355/m.49513 type:complete len:90 (-) Transcript_20355:39-308(-)